MKSPYSHCKPFCVQLEPSAGAGLGQEDEEVEPSPFLPESFADDPSEADPSPFVVPPSSETDDELPPHAENVAAEIANAKSAHAAKRGEASLRFIVMATSR